MRILVTGARGKVGAATVAALHEAGHEVTATDLHRPLYEAQRGAVPYVQADLTDPGDAFALVRGHRARLVPYALGDRPYPGWAAGKDLGPVGLQPAEEPGIADQPVFDHFRVTCSEFPVGQAVERARIG